MRTSITVTPTQLVVSVLGPLRHTYDWNMCGPFSSHALRPSFGMRFIMFDYPPEASTRRGARNRARYGVSSLVAAGVLASKAHAIVDALNAARTADDPVSAAAGAFSRASTRRQPRPWSLTLAALLGVVVAVLAVDAVGPMLLGVLLLVFGVMARARSIVHEADRFVITIDPGRIPRRLSPYLGSCGIAMIGAGLIRLAWPL